MPDSNAGPYRAIHTHAPYVGKLGDVYTRPNARDTGGARVFPGVGCETA